MSGDRILTGLGLRLLAVMLLTFMAALIKLAEAHGATLPELMLFRQLFAVPVVVAWVALGPGLETLRTKRLGAHATRAALGLVGMTFTFGALLLSAVLGAALAALFAMSRWVELSLFPFAIVLQVTPIVAIAPLILIYVDSTTAALLLCAWIVAFFPVLSNTVIGLRSADPNLRDLFTLYRASRWQRLRLLLVPSALPHFLAGLKIAGGLSLIGAVVAEFTAGAAGRETGLASRILEASFRTEVPKMFAALVLVSLTGVAIFLAFNLLSRWLLGRWHASEAPSGDRTP